MGDGRWGTTTADWKEEAGSFKLGWICVQSRRGSGNAVRLLGLLHPMHPLARQESCFR
jgi:hypothetical protein